VSTPYSASSLWSTLHSPAHKMRHQQPPHEQYFRLKLLRLAKQASQAALNFRPKVEHPMMVTQFRNMPLHQLLHDPVRATIFYRGWEARTMDIRLPTTNLRTRRLPWHQHTSAERTNVMKSTTPNYNNEPSNRSFLPIVRCHASTSADNFGFWGPIITSRKVTTAPLYFAKTANKISKYKRLLIKKKKRKNRQLLEIQTTQIVDHSETTLHLRNISTKDPTNQEPEISTNKVESDLGVASDHRWHQAKQDGSVTTGSRVRIPYTETF